MWQGQAEGAKEGGWVDWRRGRGLGTELLIPQYFLSGSWFCSQGLPSCASFTMSRVSWCLSARKNGILGPEFLLRESSSYPL